MKTGHAGAQGTIEYLVILAVIVVIGLVVVSLATGLFGSPASQISSATIEMGAMTGPIGITESVADASGNGIIRLRNNSGESLTVESISSEGGNNSYSLSVPAGEEAAFSLGDIGECACEGATGTKECTYEIIYLSANGLRKTATIRVSVACVSDASAAQSGTPAEIPAPSVLLASPANGGSGTSNSFVFEYSESSVSDVTSCSLLIDGSVDQTTYDYPYNTFSKTFLDREGAFTWDVRCTDIGGKSATSSNGPFSFTFDSPLLLSSCIDLNGMNGNLGGHYSALSDIDCYADTHAGGALWNGGSGFAQIGDCGPDKICDNADDRPFTGAFDGKGKKVSGIFLNRLEYSTGMFGRTSAAASISNLILEDVNFSSYGTAGGLVGKNYGSISNVTVDGNVYGTGYVGGIAGTNYGSITRCRFEGLVSDRSGKSGLVGNVGGIAGYTATGISRCSFSGSVVSRYNYVGGIAGYVSGAGTSINDSYSEGSVVSSLGDPRVIGGIAGFTAGPINRCYSSAAVSGTNNIGGLVGRTSAAVSSSFSAGNASGSSDTGALIGYTFGAVTSSYFSGTPNNGLGTYVSYPAPFYPKAELGGDYNVPMQHNAAPANDWNFIGTWQKRDGNYPSLR